MRIKENLTAIATSIPETVTLIAVSKTKPAATIMDAYQAGHRIFGENKIQEMTEKYHILPKDIEWHMIGHLQTNKIKYMVSFVHLIHGVDRYKVLKEVDKQAKQHNRKINCLLQLKIAKEETKFGMSIEDAKTIISADEFKLLDNVKIIGLMGMASFTNDQDIIKNEFKTLKTYFDDLKQYKSENFDLQELSMGMSSDYKIAIENGSTMIRVGSSIFGSRNYN